MSLTNPRAYRAYMTIDHIVPLNKGGTNNIENLRGLCRACNGRKSDKTDGVRTWINNNGLYVSEMENNGYTRGVNGRRTEKSRK